MTALPATPATGGPRNGHLGSATDAPLEVGLAPTPDGWTVTLASPGSGLHLSDLLPAVEAFGLHVVDASTSTLGQGAHQRLAVTSTHASDDDQQERVAAALQAVLSGRTVVDELLELVTTTRLRWEQVEVLRAYRRLLELVGTGWSMGQVNRALRTNPEPTRALVGVFDAHLSPTGDAVTAAAADHILETLRAGIESLDDDRIIGDIGQAIHATLRTNAFRPDRAVVLPDGRAIEVLALKLRSRDVPGVPAPVPHAEILVTSTLTDGVHLRGGTIARGGLRASDRPDDVRSEVLGLVAAQIVKNSMIVPTGAKGGFVLHDPPTSPGAHAAAVEDAYRVYVHGLLSVTDDVVDGEVVGPPDVRRRDGDDPYLVVAADKGTARLSDTANEIATEAGFWLGDAFASGGSSGYDHKALGITARGAWVAIARHFRELGIDIFTDELSVAGIGDMSGDVFGNGLLTSPTLRLVAAFDHRDIFVDPDPDPTATFAERRRLFDLPSSSWQDFDRELISEGGGVFPRNAKRVDLSPQVRELLRLEDRAVPPNELIRAILRANVDLLYAGGIGTYVTASDEPDVDDRANAAIRVTADEVRARVIGEGANLAITQRARIEYARRGGRIDQDAIHNAAGVAISDREVNLKILMAPGLADESLTLSERNALLHDATDDVVAAVLADVDAQVWLLSREQAASAQHIAAHGRQLARLEEAGLVDRDVDALPDAEDLRRRAEAGGGLTRPELATVVAATKRATAALVAGSDLVSAACGRPALVDYFPTVVRQRCGDAITSHRLADEITALRIASGTIDRVGPTTIHELARAFEVAPIAAISALWAAQRILAGDDWWRRLQDLAAEVPTTTLDKVAAALRDLQVQVATGLLRDDRSGPMHIDEVVDTLTPVAAATADVTDTEAMTGPAAQRRMRLLDDLVPDDLAVVVATARDRARLLDVAWLTARQGAPDDMAAAVAAALDALRRVDDRLRLADIEVAMRRHLGTSEWSQHHAAALQRDLVATRRRAAGLVIDGGRTVLGGQPHVQSARARITAALAASRDGEAANALGVAVAAARRMVDEAASPATSAPPRP